MIVLDAIKARDVALREGGEAWLCKDCYLCSECQTLRTCEAHDDDTDVIVLVAEVERLREALRQVMNVGDHPAVVVAFEALGDTAEWSPVEAANKYRVDL